MAMRDGLEEFGQAVASLAEHAEETCSKNQHAVGILRDIATKLQPSSSPTEAFAYVESERLKLAGQEIHEELNAFLFEYFAHTNAKKVGMALSNLFGALTDNIDDSHDEDVP